MTQDNNLAGDPSPTPQPRLNLGAVTQSIQDSLSAFLTNTGNTASETANDLQAYMSRIQPILEAQVERAIGDPEVAYTNVKYLWGTVAAEAGRVSLGAIYKERAAVTAIVISVLHTAIALI